MSHRVLLLVVAALLIGAAAWFLLGGSPPPPPSPVGEDDPVRPPPAPSHMSPATSAPAGGASFQTVPTPTNPPKQPTQKAVTATGSVLVVPVAPQGEVVPKEIVIDIEALGPELHAKPIPLSLEGDQYRYESILVGKYRVRIWGEFWADSTAEVTVTADQESRVEVPLVKGGLVTYKTVIGTPGADQVAESVTVSLLDGRKVPVRARFQSRTQGAESSPRVDFSATLPPNGVAMGLKPGRYTLRGVGPNGESDEKAIDVRVGETTPVLLRLIR